MFLKLMNCIGFLCNQLDNISHLVNIIYDEETTYNGTSIKELIEKENNRKKQNKETCSFQ